MYLEKTKRY